MKNDSIVFHEDSCNQCNNEIIQNQNIYVVSLTRADKLIHNNDKKFPRNHIYTNHDFKNAAIFCCLSCMLEYFN